METREELLQELAKIKKWEKGQKDLWIWDKIARLPFKLLDKVTPKFIHEKIGEYLDELGLYIQTGGKYLVSQKEILKLIQKETKKTIHSLADIKALPLHTIDQLALKIIEQRKTFATLQGASTGFGGLFTLVIDIPAILGISLKTLQEIAILYGYDPNDKHERIFIVKCLQFTSSDIVGKRAILDELSNHDKKDEHMSKVMMSQLQGWREVVLSYRDQFGWKKLFQIIPIAGALFGAFTNRSMVHELGETGMMLYKKRVIQERLNEQVKEK